MLQYTFGNANSLGERLEMIKEDIHPVQQP